MIKVRTLGLEETRGLLLELGEIAQDEAVAAAMMRAAEPVVVDAAHLLSLQAEHETGLSAESIEARRMESEPGTVVVEIGPSSQKPHGFVPKYLEFGTDRFGARPFLRPTWDGRADRFGADVNAHLAASAEKVVRRIAAQGRRARGRA